MPAITRVNGYAQPGSFYGLTPLYLKVNTGNVAFETANAAAANYYLKSESPFDKAVFAVGTQASIISLGKPSGNVFMVQVDNTCPVVSGNSTVEDNFMAVTIQKTLGANLVDITVYTGIKGDSFV